VCRRVPLNDVLNVIVIAGRPAEIWFDRPGVAVISPLLGDLEHSNGSECPVPLSQFETKPLSPLSGYSRFSVKAFPDSPDLEWTVPSISDYRQPLGAVAAKPIILYMSRVTVAR
jgi:hypothetical protein